MNSVERVKALCKERKVAVSRLERDLGYANGYISQLKKGVFPDDRLVEIAGYFAVSVEFLLSGEEQKKPAPSYEDELDAELLSLFSMLSPEAKEREIAYLRALSANQDN